MHATMTAMPSAATIIAIGLARPSKRVTSPGRPNIPPPMMQLMTKAVIVQRPIDRTKAIVRLTSWSEVYHHTRISAQCDEILWPHSDTDRDCGGLTTNSTCLVSRKPEKLRRTGELASKVRVTVEKSPLHSQ